MTERILPHEHLRLLCLLRAADVPYTAIAKELSRLLNVEVAANTLKGIVCGIRNGRNFRDCRDEMLRLLKLSAESAVELVLAYRTKIEVLTDASGALAGYDASDSLVSLIERFKPRDKVDRLHDNGSGSMTGGEMARIGRKLLNGKSSRQIATEVAGQHTREQIIEFLCDVKRGRRRCSLSDLEELGRRYYPEDDQAELPDRIADFYENGVGQFSGPELLRMGLGLLEGKGNRQIAREVEGLHSSEQIRKFLDAVKNKPGQSRCKVEDLRELGRRYGAEIGASESLAGTEDDPSDSSREIDDEIVSSDGSAEDTVLESGSASPDPVTIGATDSGLVDSSDASSDGDLGLSCDTDVSPFGPGESGVDVADLDTAGNGSRSAGVGWPDDVTDDDSDARIMGDPRVLSSATGDGWTRIVNRASIYAAMGVSPRRGGWPTDRSRKVREISSDQTEELPLDHFARPSRPGVIVPGGLDEPRAVAPNDHLFGARAVFKFNGAGEITTIDLDVPSEG